MKDRRMLRRFRFFLSAFILFFANPFASPAQKDNSPETNAELSVYWNSMERILFTELPADTTVAIDCHLLDSATFYFYDYIKIARNVLPPLVFKTKAVYYLLELQTRFRDIFSRNPKANYCYKAKNYTVLKIALKLDPNSVMVKNNLLLFNSEIQNLEHIETVAILKDVERENIRQQDSLKQKVKLLNEQETEIQTQKDLLFEHEVKLKNQYNELSFNDKKIQQQRRLLSAQGSEIQNQYIIISLFVFALLLVALILTIVIRSLGVTRRQKHIIELQKNEVSRQKEIVDVHQKEIIDSIIYAKRIQNAMLKEEEHVSLHLPEHFVLFKPKDIVSGDFYWSMEKDHYWYIAAADCTGHGVPGGFLTMIGTAFLNEINASPQLLSPAEILNQLRTRFIKQLGQTGVFGVNNDGMDISLCMVEIKNSSGNRQQYSSMQWAGANSPLYIIRGDVLEEINPNKQPIGYFDRPQPFTNHSFLLNKGDTFFISSDGYADQFGANDKKLKKKAFKEIIMSVQGKTLAEQKQYLDQFHKNWKGDMMQTDDICVIGIRV
jgi:serine phosphatase RsbU (regulator of sigma subunit)